MNEIILNLEKISKLAAKSTDIREVESEIKLARETVKKVGANPMLQTLDSELSTWQSKLLVILKEPIGRQGMSKHCLHWVEKLKNG